MADELTSKIENNAAFLNLEMAWLAQMIDLRLRTYFEGTQPAPLPPEAMPSATLVDSTYAAFIMDSGLDLPGRLVLALSFAPVVNPALLDAFTVRNSAADKKFAEFGGRISTGDSFIPTVETALFLLSGGDLALRFKYYGLFSAEQPLISRGVIELTATATDNPMNSATLSITAEYLEYFITGQKKTHTYGDNFPAKPITTGLNWDDYVTVESTTAGIREIIDWIRLGETVLNMPGLRNRLKPGYKAMFHGPPGTGKTLAAALIGKSTGSDVYRVDLSQVVSRYIGETEKNLAKVFDRAENKKWILFFDEADALFGKRTEISNSNDRFANQEVAYLLQRIEDHNGLVILATNLKDNIDAAFLRRFQSVILFPMPGAEQRDMLWRRSFPINIEYAQDINWSKIAQNHALSGAAIANVVRYCCLQCVIRGDQTATLTDLEAGIKKEQHKEGKIF